MRAPGPAYPFLAIPDAMLLLRDPRLFIRRGAAKHGKVFRTLMPGPKGFTDLVFLLGSDGNERILAPPYKDDFSWYEGYAFTMEAIFGSDHLILLDDTPERAAHRERLRMLLPAFHSRLDADYIPAMRRITEAHLWRWPDAGEIDLARAVKAISFHVGAEIFLGASDDEVPALQALFEEIGLGLFSVFRVKLPGFRFQRGRVARGKLAAILAAKIAAYRRDGLPKNMLGQLMSPTQVGDDGEPVGVLGDETLVSELVAFLFAGYDTTSSLMTAWWRAIAERPDAYARVVEEALGLAELTMPAMQDERWLDASLVEAERLHPPLAFSMRGVLRDFDFGGYTIRRGDKVAYSAWYTGRDEALFPDAERFLPERFLETRRAPPYSMVGFGGGARACIGKRFASVEMRTLVNVILRAFAIEFIPGQSDEVFFNPTPQLKHGFRVKVRRR